MIFLRFQEVMIMAYAVTLVAPTSFRHALSVIEYSFPFLPRQAQSTAFLKAIRGFSLKYLLCSGFWLVGSLEKNGRNFVVTHVILSSL